MYIVLLILDFLYHGFHVSGYKQEEELAVIRRRQATFARERDAEMAEVQRMEAEVKRKSAEK